MTSCEFHLPKVDMDAASDHKLATITEVGLSKVLFRSQYKGLLDVTEPPVIKDCVNINQFIDTRLALYCPNHTQSVERGVQSLLQNQQNALVVKSGRLEKLFAKLQLEAWIGLAKTLKLLEKLLTRKKMNR